MNEKSKHILVAFDSSHQSQEALKVANNMIQEDDGHITVVQVFENIAITSLDAMTLKELSNYANTESNEMMDLFRQRVAEVEGLDEERISFVTLEGSPKRELVKYAKARNVDLIVMGATGTHAVERILIGSTTSYVVNHAHCNVLVVK